MAENGATVLIVDDEMAIRELLEDHMILLGHRPVLAEDGSAALTLLEEEVPDLILLDIMMPKLDGHGVLVPAHHEKHSLRTDRASRPTLIAEYTACRRDLASGRAGCAST